MTSNKASLKYLGAFVAVAGVGLGGIFYADYRAKVQAEEKALQQNETRIADCIALKGKSYSCGRVRLALADEETKNKVSPFIQKWKDDKAAAEAETRKKNEEWRKKQVAVRKEQQRVKAAADAKFKAEGWWQQEPGIFVRWCTKTCSRAEVIGDSAYWLMEVWCKERACGDIYAQMNIEKNGTVVGWTNDTLFLSRGQRGVLTFQKYNLPGGGASYQGQLVKFSARG